MTWARSGPFKRPVPCSVTVRSGLETADGKKTICPKIEKSKSSGTSLVNYAVKPSWTEAEVLLSWIAITGKNPAPWTVAAPQVLGTEIVNLAMGRFRR